MSELKECPFCGSKDVGGAGGIVNCYGCGAETRKAIATEAAVILWNTRTDKWISVEDRLPETLCKVMGYWEHSGHFDTAVYIKHEEGGGRWGSKVGLITHWHIPEPPQNK